MKSTQAAISELTKRIDQTTIIHDVDGLEAIRSSNPSAKVLATHSETFHCDEVFAMVLLLMKYPDSTIIRTRQPELLDKAEIVVDVGNEYDAKRQRFDHHQREFKDTFSHDFTTTKMSSAGLVFKHYGKEILGSFFEISGDKMIELIHQRLYQVLFEYVDARDNGVSISSDGQLKYELQTDIGTRVSKLNVRWYENDWSADTINARFKQAMILAAKEMIPFVEEIVSDWWPARAIVEAAMKMRNDIHSSGKILCFEKNCPFDEHLYELEKVMGCEQILYVIYPGGHNNWRVRAVAKAKGMFENRKPLPQKLRGLRLEELRDQSGVKDAEFIHNGGFIGGALSKEGALALAALGLEAE